MVVCPLSAIKHGYPDAKSILVTKPLSAGSHRVLGGGSLFIKALFLLFLMSTVGTEDAGLDKPLV